MLYLLCLVHNCTHSIYTRCLSHSILFIKGGELLHCHQVVLAVRSKYFAMMFDSPIFEGRHVPVRVEEVDAGVFQCLIKFLYTDTVRTSFQDQDATSGPCMTPDNAVEILKACERYGASRLKRLCEFFIQKMVDEDSTDEVLEVATL